MTIPTFRETAVLVVSAMALAFAFPIIHWFPLGWVALAPVFVIVRRATPRGAAVRMLLAGFVFHVILLHWLAANVYWEGGWALVGQQLLCLLLAAFWAGAGWLWVWGIPRLPRLHPPLIIAVLWVCVEWLHANVFTGFGWSALGYSQAPDRWLLQIAALGGVSGISFLLVWANALLAELWERRGRAPLQWAVLALVVLAPHGTGAWLLRPPAEAPAFTVGMYQSRYAQEMKWDPDFTQIMLDMAVEQSYRLSEAEEVDLLVWPEALITDHYERPDLWHGIRELVTLTGVPLYAGTVRIGPGGEDYNSSILVTPEAEVVGVYDKVHLAPFGEYLPYADYLAFLRSVVPADTTPGVDQKLLTWNGWRMGPLICFEVLFSPMAAYLRAEGADFLVVITNLGWFGMSGALLQELEIARLRAVETRLPLIHVSNTGISGVFDPYGRFQLIDSVVNRDAYRKWPQAALTPAMTMRQRMVAALPVAPPAEHPLPWGPVYFSPFCVALTMLWGFAAALAPRLRARGAGASP